MVRLRLLMGRFFQGFSPISCVAFCQALLMLNIFTAANGWFAVTNVLELMLWCTVLVSAYIRRAIFCLADARVLILLAFVVWIAVAMCWGQASVGERLEELLSWRKLLLFPLALVIFDTRESRLLFLTVFISWVFIYSLVSWALYLARSTHEIDAAYLLENDVVQAMFFAFAALSAFTLKAKGDLSWRPLVFGLIILTLASNVFIVATGRSGYLFLAVGVMVMVWHITNRYRVGLTAILLLSIIVGFMVSERPSSMLVQGINEVLSHEDHDAGYTSMGIRLVMWENTVEVIKASPIFGAGSGSFYLEYADVVQGGNGWRYEISDDPHNQYLHLWAEQGLLGLLLLMAFAYICFLTVPATSFGILAACLIAGFCATSMFSGHFSTFVEGRLFWIMLGVCLSGSELSLSDLRSKLGK